MRKQVLPRQMKYVAHSSLLSLSFSKQKPFTFQLDENRARKLCIPVQDKKYITNYQDYRMWHTIRCLLSRYIRLCIKIHVFQNSHHFLQLRMHWIREYNPKCKKHNRVPFETIELLSEEHHNFSLVSLLDIRTLLKVTAKTHNPNSRQSILTIYFRLCLLLLCLKISSS